MSQSEGFLIGIPPALWPHGGNILVRFAGFQLDQQRAELRGPDGKAIKLRPKTFDMLQLFAANPGRTVSKSELMKAVWSDVNVGEDSLFQCIREIRTALGDEQRQLLKLVSGRGYLFDTKVTDEPAAAPAVVSSFAETAEPAKPGWPRLVLRGPVALAGVAGFGAILGLAVAIPIFAPEFIFARMPPTIAVMPLYDASNDSGVAAMAAGVTQRLTDGLAKIENIRVVRPQSGTAASSGTRLPASAPASDFVVTGELRKEDNAWTLQARMVTTESQAVAPLASILVEIKDTDPGLQKERLAAGIGQQLALRLNALLNTSTRSADAGSAKVAIEQANASITQTSRERFTAAQSMLETAISSDPDNIDLAVALAGMQMRGVQMAWYSAADGQAAEKKAKAMLERLLRAKPNHIPALESYCRFLNATNQFVESLVACARTLNFDPWSGVALYHIGLAQIQLGRFEDALATFKQADRFDTPQVSRWTWAVGAGWACVLMGRDEEALPWLQRSIAITPASGRPLMLLAAAYQRLGKQKEAEEAVAKALIIRPGTTALNVAPPTTNSSPVFLAASKRVIMSMVDAGLPAH